MSVSRTSRVSSHSHAIRHPGRTGYSGSYVQRQDVTRRVTDALWLSGSGSRGGSSWGSVASCASSSSAASKSPPEAGSKPSRTPRAKVLLATGRGGWLAGVVYDSCTSTVGQYGTYPLGFTHNRSCGSRSPPCQPHRGHLEYYYQEKAFGTSFGTVKVAACLCLQVFFAWLGSCVRQE